jgi:hypothetical protein
VRDTNYLTIEFPGGVLGGKFLAYGSTVEDHPFLVGFEILTAVIVITKSSIFWDMSRAVH